MSKRHNAVVHKSQRIYSKKEVAQVLAKHHAVLDPERVTADAGDKTIRVFRVHYMNKTLWFPSLRDIMTWAADPGKYKFDAPNKPVEAIPAAWVQDPVVDPVDYSKPDSLGLQ
jgi:hypothetical protein